MVPGRRPVLVWLNGLFVPATIISVWIVCPASRIQKPRAVIGAPPLLNILPVKATDVLVVAPLVIVNVGAVTIVGVPCALTNGPGPTEFTALTLNVWVPLGKFVKMCDVLLWAVIHAPVPTDTSYLVIVAPPLDSGACQCNVT